MEDISTNTARPSPQSLIVSGKPHISLNRFHFCCTCIGEDFTTFLDAFAELSKNYGVEETKPSMNVSEHTQTDEELSLTGVALGRIVLEEMKK